MKGLSSPVVLPIYPLPGVTNEALRYAVWLSPDDVVVEIPDVLLRLFDDVVDLRPSVPLDCHWASLLRVTSASYLPFIYSASSVKVPISPSTRVCKSSMILDDMSASRAPAATGS